MATKPPTRLKLRPVQAKQANVTKLLEIQPILSLKLRIGPWQSNASRSGKSPCYITGNQLQITHFHSKQLVCQSLVLKFEAFESDNLISPSWGPFQRPPLVLSTSLGHSCQCFSLSKWLETFKPTKITKSGRQTAHCLKKL